MNIVQIGSKIPGNNVKVIQFTSDYYFPEADLIIVQLSALVTEINGKFNNSNNPQVVNNLVKSIGDRSEQLLQFYSHNGSVLLIIDYSPIMVFPTMNGNVKLNLLSVLGLSKEVEFIQQSGQSIQTSYSFASWPSSFSFKFKGYFNSIQSSVIVSIERGKKTLGFYEKLKSGTLIVLPDFSVAVTSENWEEVCDDLIAGIKSLINQINRSLDEIPNTPDWASEIFVGREKEEKKKLDKLLTERSKLAIDILTQENLISKFGKIKSILFTDGAHLEQVIGFLLSEFKFEVSTPEGNNEDFYIRYDDFEAVIEVKGQKGSGTTQNAAQVDKWSTNHLIENEKKPKPILILNTFKEKPLAERLENSFPQNMLDYSIPRDHCLILTKTILDMYIDFDAGLLDTLEIKNLFLNTTGVLEYKARFTA